MKLQGNIVFIKSPNMFEITQGILYRLSLISLSLIIERNNQLLYENGMQSITLIPKIKFCFTRVHYPTVLSRNPIFFAYP